MGKRNLEQRWAIKFCVKLNENATETYEKFKKRLIESMLYQGHRFLGGIKHFWVAVRVWKTNLVLEDLCTSKTDENVTKVRDLVRSDRRLTDWSVVCWIWIAKPSMKFWPSNWACRWFVPSWSQKFSPMNKWKIEGMCAWTFLNASKMTNIFSNMS